VTNERRIVNFRTPMLWAIGCIVVLAIGGLTGIVIGNAGTDRVLHDTYFVAPHLHYVLSLAAVFGFFAGWYYLFPKVTGYAYSDLLGMIHFWSYFIGVNTMLVPHVLVVVVLAGRVGDAPDAFRHWNLVSSIGAYVCAAGSLVFIGNMVLSLLRRRPAG
jgi:cytochrome c oxidase subunit I